MGSKNDSESRIISTNLLPKMSELAQRVPSRVPKYDRRERKYENKERTYTKFVRTIRSYTKGFGGYEDIARAILRRKLRLIRRGEKNLCCFYNFTDYKYSKKLGVPMQNYSKILIMILNIIKN